MTLFEVWNSVSHRNVLACDWQDDELAWRQREIFDRERKKEICKWRDIASWYSATDPVLPVSYVKLSELTPRIHIVLQNRWKLLSHVNSQSLIGNNKKVTLLSLGGNCKGVVMSWFAKDKHLWQIELTCLNCRPIISRSGHSSQWRWLL